MCPPSSAWARGGCPSSRFRRPIMPKARRLVLEYLEDLTGAILDEPGVVENFVAKRPGIYALYRKGVLYYVGLATNLRARLRQHQKDRHQGIWDRFSVYITSNDEHLKDLESLLLRVTKKPNGNKQNGKFQDAINRKPDLLREDRARYAEKRREDFAIQAKPKLVEKATVRFIKRSGPFALRGFHKGEEIKALLKKDYTVKIGKLEFSSPSAAASHVTGHPTNGRWFWRIKVQDDWVRLKVYEEG